MISSASVIRQLFQTSATNDTAISTASIGTNFYWDTSNAGSSTSTIDTIGQWPTGDQYIQRLTVRPGNASVEVPDRMPAPREFNRYLNGSDLLEEFIEFLGTQGVKQCEVMSLPVELFIKWLIIRACEEDDEEPNVVMPTLPSRDARRIRCKYCGQYMENGVEVPLHEDCAERYFARSKLRQTT